MVRVRNISTKKNVISNGFKYGKTFAEVDKEIDLINSQLSIFDLEGIEL